MRQRMNRISLRIVTPATIEDQIRGEEEQANVLRKMSEMPGGFDIRLPGQPGLGIAGRDATQGCAMNDQFRLVALEGRARRGKIREIQFRMLMGAPCPVCWCGVRDMTADESARAGDPDRAAHANQSTAG